jgi:hypothetical protein
VQVETEQRPNPEGTQFISDGIKQLNVAEEQSVIESLLCLECVHFLDFIKLFLGAFEMLTELERGTMSENVLAKRAYFVRLDRDSLSVP